MFLQRKTESKNLMKKALYARLAAFSLAAAASAPAFAVIDVAAATTGIADAQVAVLAVLAAMITMAAAIFGVRKVLRLLGR